MRNVYVRGRRDAEKYDSKDLFIFRLSFLRETLARQLFKRLFMNYVNWRLFSCFFLLALST